MTDHVERYGNAKAAGPALPWIPWQRYALVVALDGNPPKCLGRFRRREALCKSVLNLKRFKGLAANIVDTKGELKCGEAV